MDSADKECLRRNHLMLMNEVPYVIDSVMDYLYEHKVVSGIMMCEFKNVASNIYKTRAVLIYLPKRGPQAFDKFCEALRRAGLEDVCAILKSR